LEAVKTKKTNEDPAIQINETQPFYCRSRSVMSVEGLCAYKYHNIRPT